jgi:hypothetical protein
VVLSLVAEGLLQTWIWFAVYPVPMFADVRQCQLDLHAAVHFHVRNPQSRERQLMHGSEGKLAISVLVYMEM